MLDYFFSKLKLSERKARRIETLGIFGIVLITQNREKIHVLDVLSTIPSNEKLLNSIEVK